MEDARLPGLDLAALRRLALFVSAAESGVEHAEALRRDPAGFSDVYRGRLEKAAGKSAVELARAYRDLHLAADAIRDGLSAYAAVLLPTTPVAPFPFDRPQPETTAELTTLGSVSGLAATAFPVGLDDEGLPRSVQAGGMGRRDHARPRPPARPGPRRPARLSRLRGARRQCAERGDGAATAARA